MKQINEMTIKDLEYILAYYYAERIEIENISNKIVLMKYYARLGEWEIKKYKLNSQLIEIKEQIHRLKHSYPEGKKDKELIFGNPQKKERLSKKIHFMESQWKKSMRQYRMEEYLEKKREENKALFRDIVFKCSRDVHPELDNEEIKPFKKAEKAYIEGRIGSLKSIHSDVQKMSIPEIFYTVDGYDEEKLRLEEKIREAKAWHHLAKSKYPFNLEEIVNDENKINKKIESLQDQIEDLQEQILKEKAVLINLK